MEVLMNFFSLGRASTAKSAGKSRNGGDQTGQGEAENSGSGNDRRVCSAHSKPASSSNGWPIFRDSRTVQPRSKPDDRPRLFFEPWFDGPEPYFLDACFLCKIPLRKDRDIYMYRGNIPFCSEECREEQIKIDLGMESRRLLLKASATRKERENNSSRSVEVRAARTAVAG